MRIGQVAKNAGVSVQTVRLYERVGVIPSATRSDSGYREYSVETVDHVRAVKYGQRVGFTLAEMKTFVDLHQPSSQSPEALTQFLHEKIALIDAQITQLTAIRAALITLSASDYNWNVEGDCPIVQLLGGITDHIQTEIRSQS